MEALHRPVAMCATALVTVGIAAGAAQARTENVVAAIKHQQRTLKRAAASENLKHIKIRTRAQARRAEPKFRTLASDMDVAATAVSKASTDSSAQRRGKRDWVMGARGEARGFTQFGDMLKDLAGGHRSAAKREALKAEQTVLDASRTLLRAEKLLKMKGA